MTKWTFRKKVTLTLGFALLPLCAIGWTRLRQVVPGTCQYVINDAWAGLRCSLSFVSADTGSDLAIVDAGPWDPGSPYTPCSMVSFTGEVWRNGSLYRTMTTTSGGHLKATLPSGWTSGLTDYKVIIKNASGVEYWHQIEQQISIH
jgi:hypothetical protein